VCHQRQNGFLTADYRDVDGLIAWLSRNTRLPRIHPAERDSFAQATPKSVGGTLRCNHLEICIFSFRMSFLAVNQ